MKKFNLFLALLIYNLFIVPLLFIAFHILGLFNKKIKTGIKGRKNLLKKFETEVKQKIDPQKPTFWFHSSSLGEFEQAKPIIRKLKESFNPNVIATFFSPSGYEHSKNYPFADIISYIPFDSVFTAKKVHLAYKIAEDISFFDEIRPLAKSSFLRKKSELHTLSCKCYNRREKNIIHVQKIFLQHFLRDV
jgi:3-deoxy-D-manno-octulosonic-acid transferase